MNDSEWRLVEDAALALRVSWGAVKKWRQRRSVPHKWRVPIFRHTQGRVSLEALEASDGEKAA